MNGNIPEHHKRNVVYFTSSAEAYYNIGTLFYDTNDIFIADYFYRCSLIIDEHSSHALCNYGATLASLGKTDKAVEIYRRCLANTPDLAEAHYGLGNQQRTARLRPEMPDPYVSLGIQFQENREFLKSADCFRRAICNKPDQADSLSGLGAIYLENGQTDIALHLFIKTHFIDQDSSDCLSNIGILYGRIGRNSAAENFYKLALLKRPDHSQALSNLGGIFTEAGSPDEAVVLCRRALSVPLLQSDTLFNLGNAFKQKGQTDTAIHCYRLVLILTPQYSKATCNIGAILLDRNRRQEAKEWFRKALVLSPGHTDSLCNMGKVLKDGARTDIAITFFKRAVTLAPDSTQGLCLLGNTIQDCTAGDSEKYFTRAFSIRPRDYNVYKDILIFATYRDDLTQKQFKDIHLNFNEAFAQSDPFRIAPFDLSLQRPKLKIGYLSSDFRRHPVTDSLLPVVRHHDKSQFSIHFYSQTRLPDEITEELQCLADGWRDIVYLSDRQTAELVRADGIDILVFLAGRFDENRPTIASHRAAPVQISLYDVATSGLAEMDYFISDRRLNPRLSEEYFSERVLHLPTFQTIMAPSSLPPISPQTNNAGAVFACFNNPRKISPLVLSAWGRVLSPRPGSRLILKYLDHYADEAVRHRITTGLTAAGADARQVEFISEVDSTDQLLARYNGVDLALDPFPFSGSTTSVQALSMGIPVITLAGQRMAGRWTSSMLQVLGLETCIGRSAEDYVATAGHLADNLSHWRKRRLDIRHRLFRSCLCDIRGRTRQLERLYRAVWIRACSRKTW